MTLDLCPTSNWQAGIVPSVAAHPLARLAPGRRPGHAQHGRHDGLGHHAVRGVPGAVETIGLTVPELWAIDRHALDVAFADEADLAPLRAEFAAWGAGIPELAERDVDRRGRDRTG